MPLSGVTAIAARFPFFGKENMFFSDKMTIAIPLDEGV
jgi:hypothetical protein